MSNNANIQNTAPINSKVQNTSPIMRGGVVVETEQYYTQVLTAGMYILPWLTYPTAGTVQNPVSF